MNFLLCIVQYLVIAIGIAGVGVVGGAIGITLWKRKNEKNAGEQADK